MASAPAVLSFKLNSGHLIPAIGVGSGGDYGKTVDSEAVAQVILSAIEVGYRHIDTAAMYGSETGIGQGLAEAFRKGLVKREDVFVTTKLHMRDFEPEDARIALKTSLAKLQLDYVDLYLLHWPLKLKKEFQFPLKAEHFPPNNDLLPTWRALESFQREGLVKSIGVSNFTVEKLEALLPHVSIVPAVNQVELSTNWQQRKLKEYSDRKGIHLTGFSPLGAPGKSYGKSALDNPVVKELAEKHHKTPAQVVLRWAVTYGVSVVPQTSKKHRLIENFGIFDWNLSDKDLGRIATLEQKRMMLGDFFVHPDGPYKTLEQLWDGDL